MRGELLKASEEAFALLERCYQRLIAGWLMRQRSSGPCSRLTAEVFAAAYLGAARFR